MTKKFAPLLLLLFPIVLFSIIFYRGEKRFQKMEQDFTTRSINGHITLLKKATRGEVLINIKDVTSNTELEYYLPKSWFFEENKIQAGDSVSKDGVSKKIKFYRNQNGNYILCCEYEFSL